MRETSRVPVGAFRMGYPSGDPPPLSSGDQKRIGGSIAIFEACTRDALARTGLALGVRNGPDLVALPVADHPAVSNRQHRRVGLSAATRPTRGVERGPAARRRR